MPLSNDDLKKIRDIVWNTDTAPAPGGAAVEDPTRRHVDILRDTYSGVQEVKAAVAALSGEVPAEDRQALAATLLDGLTAEEIVAAVPDGLAREVAGRLAARIADSVS